LKCLAVGGLKGGISIAFAMLVSRDERLAPQLREIVDLLLFFLKKIIYFNFLVLF
jgi:hypothetical protein